MRSLLIVPIDAGRTLAAALTSEADALILDIETAAASGRDAARRDVAALFLAEAAQRDPRPLLFVRVNGLATDLTDPDLDAIVPVRPDGIVLPGTVGGADVAQLGAKLAVREAENGWPDGSIRILATIGTAPGVIGLGTLPGASRRLVGLAWDSEALAADLGMAALRTSSGQQGDPRRMARSLTRFAAAAAGVAAIDTACSDCDDLDRLAAECGEARRDGFAAKLAVHPRQVPVINAAFARAAEDATQ